MKRVVRRDGDRGSAVVEFCLFAVVALVPLAWAALALAELTATHAATQAAAGEALRAFLSAPSESLAHQRATAAAELALTDQAGVRDVVVDVSCAAQPCLQPGAQVRVDVHLQAQLPSIPVLGVEPARSLRATQYGVVDAYVAVR